MDKNEVKTYISDNLNQLFSFAYVLIPDELFAQQLAVDSLTQLLCSEKQEGVGEVSLEKELFRSMFLLASKRVHHLSLNNNWLGDDKAFLFTCGIEKRATLFLKDTVGLSFHEIAFILDQQHSYIQNSYVQAQGMLSKELSKEYSIDG